MQDFSRAWTDEQLYAKYGCSKDEINFIESMIRPMDNEIGVKPKNLVVKIKHKRNWIWRVVNNISRKVRITHHLSK